MTNEKPRVFFGTMYSGESELADCKQAIAAQKYLSNIQHHIISGLREKNAHDELWKSWENCKNDFDLFVKVDADTIIANDHAISDVWNLFATNKRVTGVQVRLLDYYTNSLIAGLNFFSPVVKFKTSPDLYCDRVDTNHDIVLKGEAVKHLEPIGYHCKNPSKIQSFHYGLHRMLKHQIDTIRNVINAPQEEKRMYAIYGAAYALRHTQKFLNDGSSYENEAFMECFKELESLSQKEKDSLFDYVKTTIAK